MKRILLKPSVKESLNEVIDIKDDEILQKISDYIAELRLLKDVPFSYLVPDETLLPQESIRFFYLDENWLNALTDGAMSIGRVAMQDAQTDNRYFNAIAQTATSRLSSPRFEKMHKNHRRYDYAVPVSSERRTGLIVRSELVGKWKGLEVFGYDEKGLLEILRMEALSNQILICIFDGELTKFVISEPKTGLRFGIPDNGNVITLRDVSDTDDFGKPLSQGEVDFTPFIDEATGKLNVTGLAKDIQEKINSSVASPQFAFELIAVAKRAEFIKGGV